MSREKYNKTYEVTGSNLDGDPQPAQELPLVTAVLSAVTLAGLYYFLLVECPGDLAARSSGGGFLGFLRTALNTLAVAVGSHPIFAFVLFIALLSPGLLFLEHSRKYFLTLTLVSLCLWGVAFALAKQPAERLGEAIHQVLSMERDLPNPVKTGR